MLQVKSVIFDYGGVLCALPTDAQISELAGLAGLTIETFLQGYWYHRRAYDCNDLTDSKYWKEIGKSSGKTYTDQQVSEFVRHDVRFWLKLDQPMLEWSRAIRAAGIHTGIISNMPEVLGTHIRQHSRLFDEFDHVTLSYEIRSAKPEAKIYRSCLASLGLAARDTLFLDDKVENVHAAQALGMHAIEYINRSRLAGRDAHYGLPKIPR
jgi:putative hydrolase of the HAD superfamily